MKDLIRVTKAISDENRLRMLKLPMERDICVCEMEEIFPLSHSQVSRDLKMLMDAGFLKRWREGKCVVYVADIPNNNSYCNQILDLVNDSFNGSDIIESDKQKLQKVLEDQIRGKRK